jgi:hypothetical protein
VDEILDALDQRGKQLDDFTADVDLTDTTPPRQRLEADRADEDAAAAEGDSRIRVVFDKKVVNDVTKADKTSTCSPRAG